MHILFLIYSLGGGGAERVTVNLANHFVAMGHRVTIATLSDEVNESYSLDPSIVRLRLGVAIESTSPLRSLIMLVKSIRAVRGMLASLRPDAAIGMMTTSAILLALAGRPAVTKLVGSERVYPPAAPLPATWRVLRKVSYRRLDKVVAQTADIARWLRLNTHANTTVIPNPWLPPRDVGSSISPDDVVPADAKVILGTGRLIRRKRFDLLIEAFGRCAEGRQDWHLVIAGEGPLHDELLAQARQRGLADRVWLPGRVGNIARWYDRADLFALTSEFEGFPNVLLEAMGSGLACIAFDCPTGPRELIGTGRSGLLVELLSLDALAEGLRRLMDDPDLRARLRKAAVEVQSQYAIDRVARDWLTAISA